MGQKIGQAAYKHARKYWDGNILNQPSLIFNNDGNFWFQTVPGYQYTLESGTDLLNFPTIEAASSPATGHETALTLPLSGPSRYFRLRITSP
jgi:hypothetical protein